MICTADPFATKLGLMTHHHKVDCLVKRLDCCVVVKVRVTDNVQNSSEYSSERYLLSYWPSVTKLGMVMRHHGPKYHARRLVCCLQVQGHSYGSYTQNVAFKYIIWTADAFAIKLGLVAHHHKVDCLVKRLDCSVVVQVSVARKGSEFQWMFIWTILPQLLNIL